MKVQGKLTEQSAWTLESLYAARVVVVNTAARLSLQVFVFLDETDDLGVLMHAGGELGSQMDQVLLKGGEDVKSEKCSKRRRSGRAN